MAYQTIRALCFALLLFSVGHAQEDTCRYQSKGHLFNEVTEEPVSFAVIRVVETGETQLSDEYGGFAFDGLCNENVELLISVYGYHDTLIQESQGQHLHIYLKPEVFQLKEFAVEASRDPIAGTESMAQKEIKRNQLLTDPTQSLASSLEKEEGVSFISNGSNVQVPIIHGLYGNRILILNNGIKHGFQNWGPDHAPEIDPTSAHSINLIKGASGVRFGPEAMGGVIVVNPNPIRLNTPFYANVSAGFQTNGLGGNTRFELGQSKLRSGYYLSANFTKIGDRHSPNYMLTNSGKEEGSIAFGARHRTDHLDLRVDYSFVQQNLALLRSSVAESSNAFIEAINSNQPNFIRPFSYEINAPNQFSSHHFLKAQAKWTINEHNALRFVASQQFNSREEFDVRRNAEKPIINSNLSTTDSQVEWKHRGRSPWKGNVGFQFNAQDNDNLPGTGTTALIPNYNTQTISGFILEQRSFKLVTVEVGARYDHQSSDIRGRESNQSLFYDEFNFGNGSVSLGVIRRMDKRSTMRVNLSSAWRAPNMAELYIYGQHGFKTSYGLLRYYINDSNELKTDKVISIQESQVRAEQAVKLIAEWEFKSTLSQHSVTLYSHLIKNYIFERPYGISNTLRGPMPYFIMDQCDALFAGADYSWSKELSNRLNGRLGASLLWSRNISANETLIRMAPMNINYRINWQINPWRKMTQSIVSLAPSYTFKQFFAPQTIPPEDIIDGSVSINPETEIFDFKDAPDGYFLLDFSWNLEWKKFNARITVNNIFNQRYRNYLNEMRYFSDELGRNFLITLNYKIG